MSTPRPFGRLAASLAVLLVSFAVNARAADDVNASAAKEKELIALLASDAAPADKAIACKQLALYGSGQAVPELAKLLSDEQLASWARIALESIPGKEADAALREAAESLQGILLVGTINSIGVRGDEAAVKPLSKRLADPDAEVARAAAVALGKIGNDAAAGTLRGALAGTSGKVRSAVAEGCVLCAERNLAAGRADDAIAIYDEVRKADVPKQRILEATRGAILARGEEGIALLVEQFPFADKALFNIALTTARELPGRQVDQALADEVGQAAPERAVLIIGAMADRRETVATSALLAAAASGPQPVRVAAIRALGRVGDTSCLSPLLDIALEDNADLTETAKLALAELSGDKVDAEIVGRLPSAEGKMHPLLLELVGRRRIDALPSLLDAVENSDAEVRGAALTALGQTVTPEKLSVLIAQVASPKHAEDAPLAQKALLAACVRMPDRDTCAAELTGALEKSPTKTQVALLNILGSVGGANALETVGRSAKSDDPELQDVSTRLLGEWMTADAAPVLIDLAETAPGDKYQTRALRGYLRIARQFTMPEDQRARMCRKALAIAKQPAERNLVIEILKRYPHVETLKLAVEASADPELKAEAKEAALAIAQKLGGDSPQARELIDQIGLEKVKLEIIKAQYGAGDNQKDVTELLRKQAGDLPLISLPADGYNASFGGDPAEGTPKTLTIQYKINGKPGEATFAENALIILPTPK